MGHIVTVGPNACYFPLRFVFVSSCGAAWGGSEELWWGAATRLAEQGHHIAVLKPNVDERHPRVLALRERGCRVWDLKRTGPEQMWHLLNAFLPSRLEASQGRRHAVKVAGRIRYDRPHVVVVSQGENFDGLIFARLCLLFRVPYVVISQKASEFKWPEDSVRPALRRAFEQAEIAVFVSEHNRQLTEDQLGTDLRRAELIHNPVRGSQEGALSWPEGEVRLACVARLHPPEKGQDILLRILAQDRWRQRPVSVSLFGAGPSSESLLELADRLRLNSVTFGGYQEDVEAIWRTHHALALPSRAEGLPLALLEAMVCGRPAIVTDVGGSAEFVEEGRTGFVAPSATVASFGEALERAWLAQKRWPAFGQAAAARARGFLAHDPSEVLATRLVDVAGRGRQRLRWVARS